MRANAPARPEQTQSPIQSIVADAFRRATLAPTDREALDITGRALAALAQLSLAEVRHA